MTLAFVVQAAAMAAAGWLLRAADRPTAVVLAVNAVATVVVGAARLGCGAGEARWCTPSVHPLSEGLHIVAATIALVTLTLAPLVFGLRHRDRSRTALTCFVVMAVLLVWFGVADSAGWAEKVVVTVGIGWAAAAALAAGVGPDHHHRGIAHPGGLP